jgi:hypothetical protein
MLRSGGGNIDMDPDLEENLEISWYKLLVPNSDFVSLFNLDRNSQEIDFALNQHQFIDLNLSAEYLVNENDRVFYLDFIEPWVFSSDSPYDFTMCNVLIGFLVVHFLPMLISDFSDLYIYLELCVSCFYHDYRSNGLYFSDDSYMISSEKLDEPSFPPFDYFFTLFHNLLGSIFLTYGQYMDMIRRYFYSSTFLSLPPRFQKKLYPLDLIERDMIAPAISSIFTFENLSQNVLSVIQSYSNIRSARNMLLISNAFYFGTRGCLIIVTRMSLRCIVLVLLNKCFLCSLGLKN